MAPITQLISEFVEIYYKYKRYLVRRSEVENKHNKVLMLPDGTAFDLSKMYVDTTDKHGNPLECHRLAGNNSEYETFGQLPVVGVVKAREAEKPKQELFQICLSHHPSGDHMDPSADIVENYFTLSASAGEASSKVIEILKSKRGSPSYYEHWAVWKGLPQNTHPEQAIAVLKAAGLNVVE